MIFIVLSFLLLAEHLWHLFTGAWQIRIAGLLLAGILAGVTVWELVWRTRRNYARVMSSALDLVLPAHGVQRDIYLSRRWLLESGSAAEQEHVLIYVLLVLGY